MLISRLLKKFKHLPPMVMLMSTSLPTYPVLNLPVHLCDDYTHWLCQCLENHQGVHVVTLNAEMAMLAQEDLTVAEVIRDADLVIPDGAGVVLYLRFRGKKQQRCPGIELAGSLIEQLGTQAKNPWGINSDVSWVLVRDRTRTMETNLKNRATCLNFGGIRGSSPRILDSSA